MMLHDVMSAGFPAGGRGCWFRVRKRPRKRLQRLGLRIPCPRGCCGLPVRGAFQRRAYAHGKRPRARRGVLLWFGRLRVCGSLFHFLVQFRDCSVQHGVKFGVVVLLRFVVGVPDFFFVDLHQVLYLCQGHVRSRFLVLVQVLSYLWPSIFAAISANAFGIAMPRNVRFFFLPTSFSEETVSLLIPIFLLFSFILSLSSFFRFANLPPFRFRSPHPDFGERVRKGGGLTIEERGRIKRWSGGESRALAIAADGVTKRRIPAAVRGRVCTPNWRAGRPCRNSTEDQNNEKSGMPMPRSATGKGRGSARYFRDGAAGY